MHPADWPVDEPPLIGADAVYRQLVRWLEHLGQRRQFGTEALIATGDGTPGPSPEK